MRRLGGFSTHLMSRLAVISCCGRMGWQIDAVWFEYRRVELEAGLTDFVGWRRAQRSPTSKPRYLQTDIVRSGCARDAGAQARRPHQPPCRASHAFSFTRFSSNSCWYKSKTHGSQPLRQHSLSSGCSGGAGRGSGARSVIVLNPAAAPAATRCARSRPGAAMRTRVRACPLPYGCRRRPAAPRPAAAWTSHHARGSPHRPRPRHC
jgi:hypothetical protein